MNQLNISILIIVLILVLSYVNWQLGFNTPLTPVNTTSNKTNNKRYNQALKEHFSVDTKQLENDIKALNRRRNAQMNDSLRRQTMNAIAENIQEEEESAAFEASNAPEPSFNNAVSSQADTIDAMISK